MIDDNELIFVVDENDSPSKPLPRSQVHKNYLWHRTTGIWVVNSNKQILCQKRSLKKDIKPGFREAFFGGHLHPDDTYESGAETELSEELGITVKKENLIPYKIFKGDKPTHKEFQHSFVYIINSESADFRYEKEEIDEIRWYDFDDLKNILLIKNDPLWVHKPWDNEMLHFIAQIS
jgi:isopentenyldiphosphate isomerase